jgi:hypothetical protein
MERTTEIEQCVKNLNKYYDKCYYRGFDIIQSIQKINIDIKTHRNKLHKINIEYQSLLDNQQNKFSNELLKNYELPHTNDIIQINNQIESIKIMVQQETKLYTNAENIALEYHFNLQTECNTLENLESELTNIKTSIKDTISNTGIIKHSQIDAILNFDDLMRSRLVEIDVPSTVKWQKRKQVLIDNCKYIELKKTHRQKLRTIDKNIKNIYWKIVIAEEIKNKEFLKSIKQFQTDINLSNQYNSPVINSKLYDLDIHIGKMVSDVSYIKYKRDLQNRFSELENKYSTSNLYKNLDEALETYNATIEDYNKIDTGNINLPNINQIYSQCCHIQSLINEQQNKISKIKNDYITSCLTVNEIQNKLNSLGNTLNCKYEQLKQFEIIHTNITSKELTNKLNKGKIRLDKWKSEQDNIIKKNIKVLQNKRHIKLTELEILRKPYYTNTQICVL